MLPTSTELLDSFLSESWETVAALEKAEEVLSNPSTARLHRLVVLTHRLRGSAGLYGFPQLSNLSGLLERLFEQVGGLGLVERQLLLRFTRQAASVLSAALDRVARTGAEGDVGHELGQLGGSELLLELLRANPAAFVHQTPAAIRSAPLETNHADGVESNMGSGSLDSNSGTASLEAILTAFVKSDPETWSYFAPEVTEHLEMVAAAIEALASEPDSSHLNQLFRSMHTIKGAAYSVGVQPIGALSHKLEDLLVAVREGTRDWDSIVASAVLQGAEAIHAMLSAAEGRPHKLSNALDQTRTAFIVALGSTDLGLGELQAETTQSKNSVSTAVLNETKNTVQDGVVTTKAAPQAAPQASENAHGTPGASLRVSLDKVEMLLDLSGETIIARSKFERLLGRYRALADQLEQAKSRFDRTASDFVERYLNPRLSGLEERNEESNQPTVGRGLSAGELFTELEFDRYDDLNILARTIGEMANDLSEVQNQLAQHTDTFKQELEGLEKLTRTLRGEVGRMRLVPVGRLMARLRRQARQMAGIKQFRVELEGENVELDNLVLEGLSDALLHLVSNAVAHGLETPEIRRLKHKPAEGTLKIRAYQRGNFVHIEVHDDGEGINVPAVRRQAMTRGLRSAEQLEGMTDHDVIELIFLPGLSTSEAVTEVSGRGVGMDAVWSSLRRLKGEVSISSQPGQGTTISLRVPLTLVVSEVLLLECGGMSFGLPRENVRSLRAVSRDAILSEHGRMQTVIEGQMVQVFELHTLLGLSAPAQTSRLSVVALELGSSLVALAVDSFTGLEQAVVKPLDAPFENLEHIVGAMVGTEGQVILVLDALGLMRLSNTVRHTPSVNRETPVMANKQVLLVDDSLSVRRVVAERIRRLGFDVTTASDGQEALDLALERHFDAVITDLEMPRINGFELVEELRRRERTRNLPVAMLTSRASDKHARLAFELGINEYLTKPLDEIKLERFLARLRQTQQVMA
jgi:chemosensory pili system protein ChpA (sensor histidine kinase/response regulator)